MSLAVVNEDYLYWTGKGWGDVEDARVFDSFDQLLLILKTEESEYYLDLGNRNKPRYTDHEKVVRARAIPLNKEWNQNA